MVLRHCTEPQVRLVSQESYEYSDPITQFVECLFVHYDFDGAQTKLKECEQVGLKSPSINFQNLCWDGAFFGWPAFG